MLLYIESPDESNAIVNEEFPDNTTDTDEGTNSTKDDNAGKSSDESSEESDSSSSVLSTQTTAGMEEDIEYREVGMADRRGCGRGRGIG